MFTIKFKCYDTKALMYSLASELVVYQWSSNTHGSFITTSEQSFEYLCLLHFYNVFS